MRLFVAVTPPSRVLDALRRLERPVVTDLRWTTPEQWHVTLRFLGEVADPAPVAAALDDVPADLDRTAPGPVEAALGPATAWFPGRQVLQVPVTGLDDAAAAVARATAPWGDPAPSAFSGHLTVARMRGRARGPASLAGAAVRATWPVGRVELVASTLAAGGARYRLLAAVPVGRGAR